MQSFGQAVVNALSLGGLYALIALGIAVVYSIMGFVNFAHGELITVAGYTMFLVAGAPGLLVPVLALVAAGLAAVLMERIVFRPLRSAEVSTQLIASLAVSLGIQQLIRVLAGSRSRPVATPEWLGRQAHVLGLQIPWVQIVTLAAAAGLLACTAAVLYRTSLGVQMRAAAENFDMARLLDVRANRVIAAAFMISGLLAGAVGYLLVAQSGQVTPTMGFIPVLVGFVAVVIGGMGRLGGAVLGGFLLGALTVFLEVYLPSNLSNYRDSFVFSAVIVILVFRPYGLFAGEVSRVRV